MLLHLILVLWLMDAMVGVGEKVTGKWEEVSPLARRLKVPGEGSTRREGME